MFVTFSVPCQIIHLVQCLCDQKHYELTSFSVDPQSSPGWSPSTSWAPPPGPAWRPPRWSRRRGSDTGRTPTSRSLQENLPAGDIRQDLGRLLCTERRSKLKITLWRVLTHSWTFVTHCPYLVTGRMRADGAVQCLAGITRGQDAPGSIPTFSKHKNRTQCFGKCLSKKISIKKPTHLSLDATQWRVDSLLIHIRLGFCRFELS